uniref:Globin family profile domain-containing protein n=1 Tax=Romanomermis culicivorax TaxID=13658 RepID=A0A915I2C7_ROMCU
MFSDYPQYKQLWPKFKFIPDSSLMSAPELQNFAQIYMEGLKAIITRLHDRENVVETLEKIARAHMVKSVQRYHIEHMLPGLLEIMERENKRPLGDQVRKAWLKLVDVIAQLIYFVDTNFCKKTNTVGSTH